MSAEVQIRKLRIKVDLSRLRKLWRRPAVWVPAMTAAVVLAESFGLLDWMQ